ncbi:MAG: acyltransferase [Phormidesmis sp.]
MNRSSVVSRPKTLPNHAENQRFEKKKTLFELDVLRIVAMVLILFQHSVSYMGWDPRVPWLAPDLGGIGLTIFFFISGFLLSRSVLGKQAAFDAKTFLKRRLIRIVPLYWVALIVFVGVFHVEQVFKHADFSPLPATLAAHFLGIQLFLVPTTSEIFTIWYMGALIPYYILFALTAKLKPMSYCGVNLLILGLLYGVKIALEREGILSIDTRLLLHYPTFLLGVFYARVDINLDFVRKRKRMLCGLFGVLMLVLLQKTGSEGIALNTMQLVQANVGYYIYCLLGGIFFTGLAFWIAPVARKFPALVAALSASSYAVYLFHRPIYSIFYHFIVFEFSGGLVLRTLLFPITTILLVAIAYYIAKAESHLVKPRIAKLLNW